MLSWYTPTRNTESYMIHQGTKFARRFDANAYIRIVNMWSSFDLPTLSGKRSLSEAFRDYAAHGIPFMIFSISTDCCFTPKDIAAFARKLRNCGAADSRSRGRKGEPVRGAVLSHAQTKGHGGRIYP